MLLLSVLNDGVDEGFSPFILLVVGIKLDGGLNWQFNGVWACVRSLYFNCYYYYYFYMKWPVKCKKKIQHLLKLRCEWSCNGTERIPIAAKRQLSGRVGILWHLCELVAKQSWRICSFWRSFKRNPFTTYQFWMNCNYKMTVGLAMAIVQGTKSFYELAWSFFFSIGATFGTQAMLVLSPAFYFRPARTRSINCRLPHLWCSVVFSAWSLSKEASACGDSPQVKTLHWWWIMRFLFLRRSLSNGFGSEEIPFFVWANLIYVIIFAFKSYIFYFLYCLNVYC